MIVTCPHCQREFNAASATHHVNIRCPVCRGRCSVQGRRAEPLPPMLPPTAAADPARLVFLPWWSVVTLVTLVAGLLLVPLVFGMMRSERKRQAHQAVERVLNLAEDWQQDPAGFDRAVMAPEESGNSTSSDLEQRLRGVFAAPYATADQKRRAKRWLEHMAAYYSAAQAEAIYDKAVAAIDRDDFETARVELEAYAAHPFASKPRAARDLLLQIDWVSNPIRANRILVNLSDDQLAAFQADQVLPSGVLPDHPRLAAAMKEELLRRAGEEADRRKQLVTFQVGANVRNVGPTPQWRGRIEVAFENPHRYQVKITDMLVDTLDFVPGDTLTFHATEIEGSVGAKGN